ncbi:hypothetical protein H0H92_006001, partial [Tricholoma furcatifolium]
MLRVNTKDLTLSGIQQMLKPEKLVEKYTESAPFMFELMHTFSTSPNKYRRRQLQDESIVDENNDEDDDPDFDFDISERCQTREEKEWWKEMKGFQRNPIYAIVVALSMLAFVRNRATNVMPLLLGLFFKISGTSSRVMMMLSNAGICVSGRTVERLKSVISHDAIQHAIDLIKSGKMFFTIFDNINIFLRKFQQRITNLNGLIHATNCAIISLDDTDSAAADLSEYLSLRGRRSQATAQDILPTSEDDSHMSRAFTALISESLFLYCPGSR